MIPARSVRAVPASEPALLAPLGSACYSLWREAPKARGLCFLFLHMLPFDASQLYAGNVVNLFRYLYPATGAQPDSADELVKGVCATRNGDIVHDLLQSLVREEVSR